MMHTNGPDRWGVYRRCKKSLDDWKLLDDKDFISTQVYARKETERLNTDDILYEYKAFVSYDGAQVHWTRSGSL